MLCPCWLSRVKPGVCFTMVELTLACCCFVIPGFCSLAREQNLTVGEMHSCASVVQCKAVCGGSKRDPQHNRSLYTHDSILKYLCHGHAKDP